MLLQNLFLLFFEAVIYQVVFTRQPKDVCVKAGMEAFFPCTYTGTSVQSLWKINNERVYSSTKLPIYHRINGTGLIVNALPSLNMFTYSCLLEVFISDSGEYMVFESATGTLMVVGHISLGCRVSTSPTLISTMAIAKILPSAIEESTVDSQHTKTPSILAIVSSTLPSLTSTNSPIQIKYIAYSSAAGLLLGLMITTFSLFVVVCIKHGRSSDVVHREVDTPGPVYEEVMLQVNQNSRTLTESTAEGIPLERNCCYGDAKGIPLERNCCYGDARIPTPSCN